VRSESIVFQQPSFNQDLGLLQSIEDLSIEEFIPQFAIKALFVTVFSGTARFNKKCQYTEPVLHFDVPKVTRSAANQSGTLEEVEKRRIIEALKTTRGRVSGKDGAAEILGINPKTLESRMQKLGIQRNKKMPDISGDS